jgi:hypothetical protein
MRISQYVLALAALAGTLAPRSARAEDTVDDRARFTGTFRYAGKPAEDAGRRAAIDRAIDSLFFAIRGIARSRLSTETRIDPWVQFSFERGSIRVHLASGPDAVAPETGAAVDYLSDGEHSKLTERVGGGKLVQVFSTDEGRRTNEFSLAPDNTTLTEKVVISSPKLSAPLVYVLTYRRSP